MCMCGVGFHAQNWRDHTILGACHRSVTVTPHTYQRVMSHLSMSHVPLISGNVAIYRPMLAMGMSLVTNMNDSCPSYK